MIILVLSCDKNTDIFEAFHHCMEKYYPNHPEVVYATETVVNPYYKTICKDYPLEKWTRRIRETLNEIDDEQILLMVDDCFIRNPVNDKRIQYASDNLKGNIAMFNFEKAFDKNDIKSNIRGFNKRRHGSSYEVSLLCGLWDRQKLMKVISRDCNPWEIEYVQNNYGYDYYINNGEYIIDWGYKTWHPAGLFKGLWCREVVPFFEQEGIEMDYNKRGFYD